MYFFNLRDPGILAGRGHRASDDCNISLLTHLGHHVIDQRFGDSIGRTHLGEPFTGVGLRLGIVADYREFRPSALCAKR